MEELIKSLKNKLTPDKLKEQPKISEDLNKEEDVRSTLEKVDNDHIVDTDEVADQMNEISASAKMAAAEGEEQKAKTSAFNVLGKYQQDINANEDDDSPLVVKDDVSFLD